MKLLLIKNNLHVATSTVLITFYLFLHLLHTMLQSCSLILISATCWPKSTTISGASFVLSGNANTNQTKLPFSKGTSQLEIIASRFML